MAGSVRSQPARTQGKPKTYSGFFAVNFNSSISTFLVFISVLYDALGLRAVIVRPLIISGSAARSSAGGRYASCTIPPFDFEHTKLASWSGNLFEPCDIRFRGEFSFGRAVGFLFKVG